MSKSIVWVTKALTGADQLRQRMAWALSQILVVSITGINEERDAEFWLNYYDIFVRHGLDNYRDVLSEVVHSPLMGAFLTHTGSSSRDFNGKFPNENLARELMQLFTVGLFRLNADGSVQQDAGQALSTLDNDTILAFTRILTGFVRLTNGGFPESQGRWWATTLAMSGCSGSLTARLSRKMLTQRSRP